MVNHQSDQEDCTASSLKSERLPLHREPSLLPNPRMQEGSNHTCYVVHRRFSMTTTTGSS